VLANHLLSVENLHSASEIHAPWPRDTLDPVLRGPLDAQLNNKLPSYAGIVGDSPPYEQNMLWL
jgi:hypothetical protein